MEQIESARARLEDAIELPAVLDAAYDAFEEMLREIENQQDGGGGAFSAFVMSGAAAANGFRGSCSRRSSAITRS
jgi:hypothetical protein